MISVVNSKFSTHLPVNFKSTSRLISPFLVLFCISCHLEMWWSRCVHFFRIVSLSCVSWISSIIYNLFQKHRLHLSTGGDILNDKGLQEWSSPVFEIVFWIIVVPTKTLRYLQVFQRVHAHLKDGGQFVFVVPTWEEGHGQPEDDGPNAGLFRFVAISSVVVTKHFTRKFSIFTR